MKNSDRIMLQKMVNNPVQEEHLHSIEVGILEGHMPRKHPSRVRVWAERTFPLGCGRRANPSNKMEILEAHVSSGDKNVGDEKAVIGRVDSSAVDAKASISAVESRSISVNRSESRGAIDKKAWIEGVNSCIGDEKAWIDVVVTQPIASISSRGETTNDQKAQIVGVDLCVSVETVEIGGVESQLLLAKNKKKCEKLVGKRKVNEEAQTGNVVSKKANKSFSLDNIEDEALSMVQEARLVTMDGTSHLEWMVTRKKVKDTLRVFQMIYRKLLQEVESKSKESEQRLRADQMAIKLFKEKCKGLCNSRVYLGIVPGVEVGDEFHLRVEMCIIGLHRPNQAGIDYIKQGGTYIAVSIVSSGRYADDVGNCDVLEYSGCGSPNRDQKLERGNLALKNSMDAQTPVRVIHGIKGYQASNSQGTRAKLIVTYIYDGLYSVEKYWRKMGKHGHYVFVFQLRRIPGQPELAIHEMSRTRKSKARFGLCIEDISYGEEQMPIPVVNSIDDEHPMPFKYIKKLIYPSKYTSTSPRGCDCVDGCSDSEKCGCSVRNGGEIPFNYDGAIVEAKPLVFECGPSCKCAPSCHNRVSQHGIKFPLEIFKTESRGWGVRSLTSIPSGSFICEYVGELLEDEEAQRRVNDEYLFAIGNNYYDESLWEGLSTYIPDLQNRACDAVDETGFTIDGSAHGNIGRFINHSCSPNLYAQNLLYDHDNKSMPHIMFFASENIPPLQELTYHYNYAIDHVHDSDGSIKKKKCYCGSSECTGRLY